MSAGDGGRGDLSRFDTGPLSFSGPHPVFAIEEALHTERRAGSEQNLLQRWDDLGQTESLPSVEALHTGPWAEEKVDAPRLVPLSSIPGVKGSSPWPEPDRWGQFEYRPNSVWQIASAIRDAPSTKAALDLVLRHPVRLGEYRVAGQSLYFVRDGLHRLAVYEALGTKWVPALVETSRVLDPAPWRLDYSHSQWARWLLAWGLAFGRLDGFLLVPDLVQGNPWLLLPPRQAWTVARYLRALPRLLVQAGAEVTKIESEPWMFQDHDDFDKWATWFEATAYPPKWRRRLVHFVGAENRDLSVEYAYELGIAQRNASQAGVAPRCSRCQQELPAST